MPAISCPFFISLVEKVHSNKDKRPTAAEPKDTNSLGKAHIGQHRRTISVWALAAQSVNGQSPVCNSQLLFTFLKYLLTSLTKKAINVKNYVLLLFLWHFSSNNFLFFLITHKKYKKRNPEISHKSKFGNDLLLNLEIYFLNVIKIQKHINPKLHKQ